MTRRELFVTTAAAAVARQTKGAASLPALCLFSKLLPKLNWDQLGRTVKQLGLDGVDLTVRPQGHVLPARVAEDLPRAFDQIRGHGLSLPMITTGLTSASDPAARPTLGTAARLKIPYFKPGYILYTNDDVEKTLAQAKRDTESLVAVGRELGVAAGYHNHSGAYVGTAVWDIRAMIADSDPRWIGYYFDPCHATAEGGVGGWWVSLRMALPRLKMVAVKDFYWEKRPNGKWTMNTCPMGQGMVDWPKFFSILAAARFAGPISLHVEYEPKDEEKAAAADTEFLKKHVRAAYGA